MAVIYHPLTDDTDIIIRAVQVGGFWEADFSKNIPGRIPCDWVNENIPFTSEVGGCRFSGATCLLTVL